MKILNHPVSGGQAGECGFGFYGMYCFRGFCKGLGTLPAPERHVVPPNQSDILLTISTHHDMFVP